jgi:predicted metal-dependent peptidase
MADKGTNVDLAPVKEASDEEANAFRLDPHLISLMWDEPFFSKILRPVTKVKTFDIPTAGVLAKEGDVKMWWNPKFLAGLTSLQVKGLLKHECFHLIFEHTTTRKHEPHIVWNYATDLAINSMIPGDELPEGGLIPGKAFKELSAEDKMKMGEKRVGQYEALSAVIAGFPLNEASEWYFSRLMESDAAKDALTNPAGGGGEGEGEGEGPALPGTMDDHGGWDKMNDEERELIKGKIKKSLEDAVKECDATGAWGSVGSEARSTLRELISREIPWKSVLKQFCGMSRRADRTSNIRRLNRKYAGIHPGTYRSYTSSIAVYVDQSGSVGDEDLALLFGELRTLAKHTEFTLYNFDTDVDESSERVWRGNRAPGMNRTRSGGTDFRAPTLHANKNRNKFDGYLILTDGECSDPGPSRLKRGWVITPDRRLYFDAARRDFVIQMKRTKKNAV